MTEIIENTFTYKVGSNTFHFSTETIVSKGSYMIVHVTQVTDFKGTDLESDFDNGVAIHKWRIQCKHEKSEMSAIGFAAKKLIAGFNPKQLRYKEFRNNQYANI